MSLKNCSYLSFVVYSENYRNHYLDILNRSSLMKKKSEKQKVFETFVLHFKCFFLKTGSTLRTTTGEYTRRFDICYTAEYYYYYYNNYKICFNFTTGSTNRF